MSIKSVAGRGITQFLVAGLLTLSGFVGSASAVVITKGPDVGPFWQPLSGNGGTYVYANSFVAQANSAVTDLGMWLQEISPGTHDVRFEVWDSIGGNVANGPDAGNVLAGTAALTPAVDGLLNFFSAATSFSAPLVAGQSYWFAATVVGENNNGRMRVGGHTQNSVFADNGTFWYSNDPLGINFDGRSLTPEMAFQVVQQVTEPVTLALVGLGLIGLGATRRRRLLN